VTDAERYIDRAERMIRIADLVGNIESAEIAARLVKLLPAVDEGRSRQPERRGEPARYRAAVWAMWLVLALSFLIGFQHANRVPQFPSVTGSTSE
jgi:hypothetical protein